MTKNDIVTSEGIDADFMSWLWDKDREKYCLIMFGHLELITDDLVKEYFRESEDLGDYPDTIPNQFDNMTGSMNL